MGTRIASVRGLPVSKSQATTLLKEVAGIVGLGYLAQQLAIGAYKTGLPGLGGFMTIPLVFGLTYGIGRVMDAYLISKARGQILKPEEIRKIWKQGRKEGKSSSDINAAKDATSSIMDRFKDPAVEYIKTNLDELAIVASLIAIQSGQTLAPTDEAVLAAFQRYSEQTGSVEHTQSYLQSLTDDQISGVVSNVKGILHEMEFVRVENEDGDSVTAALFPETNHPGFDVILTDLDTGETWDVQLKSTNDTGYVREWMDKYPDGEILVTDEIAEKLNISSSGFENEELTVRVESFVDTLIDDAGNIDIWDMLPALSLLSVAAVVCELHQRYKTGKLSLDEFKTNAARASGIKIAKFTLLFALLSVPGVNVVVGTALVAKLILSVSSWTETMPPLHRTSELTQKQYLAPARNVGLMR